jgi:hypothetical protein
MKFDKFTRIEEGKEDIYIIDLKRRQQVYLNLVATPPSPELESSHIRPHVLNFHSNMDAISLW